MEFYQWLIEQKGLSQATASKYHLVIKNRIAEWLPSYEIPRNSIEFEALKLMIFNLYIYQERNSVGNNMYSSALNHYGNYLKQNDCRHSSIFDENLDFTSESEKLIKVRLTQNKFRKGLFEHHPKCAVTGFSNSQFLIASHIKPWSKSNHQERMDIYNGLLLSPNFDRLFDKGYITFKKNGDILISKKLDQSDKEFFNIPVKLQLRLCTEYYEYLEFHNDEIFHQV